jgi:hypothetical protein
VFFDIEDDIPGLNRDGVSTPANDFKARARVPDLERDAAKMLDGSLDSLKMCGRGAKKI